jgi:hypothetical protein
MNALPIYDWKKYLDRDQKNTNKTLRPEQNTSTK